MEKALLSEALNGIFFTFILLSIFLLIGTFLRAKVPLFQKMFLPASVIGGFIGLLLGPIVLGDYAILPIPQDWLSIASLLPGLLIIPVVASVPLGLKSAKNSVGSGKGNTTRNILIMFLILGLIGAVQNLIGVGTHYFFKLTGMVSDAYVTLGTELQAGFSGGHGTAGVVGSLLQSMNQPYWETAQGVAVTTATVGMIGGILVGIALINFAARRNYTNFIKSTESLPEEMKVGYQKDVNKQASFGRETTLSSSVDTLAYHLSLIFGVSGGAMLLVHYLKVWGVPVLSLIPAWAYAILLMYAVWGLMQKFKLDWSVDEKVKSKISGTLTEYAVVAAIISLPVQAVFTYLLPLVTMMVIGLAVTAVLAYFLCKKYFGEYWFERSMAVLGTCSGVFITGLLLLKMVDPDFKSPSLSDYSLGYSFNTVVGFALFPLNFGILIEYGVQTGLLFIAATLAIYMILLFVFGRRRGGVQNEPASLGE
ncbi:sodium/glutamate symporter [Aeromicrobium ponti]|uniref:ESS family glutamate:Na+ symporter n=1 Tax=Cytobacillus oceanisediminis TaxID=665099 RepID=A0A562K652_9BACI|nr:sodium/glutamate symporter [Cytobacillus oceanisediminis]TWH90909.1 ESS family glutamate:Na+ symporter [Cytobacillus oceanisediminis]